MSWSLSTNIGFDIETFGSTSLKNHDMYDIFASFFIHNFTLVIGYEVR